MRKKIVAGNWKMNASLEEGKKLASEVIHMIKDEVTNDTEIVLIPPFVHLTILRNLIGTSENIFLGAQNCNENEAGAYTGEVSASMLSSCGADYVILGHSERREYFNESDELLATKINQVLSNDLIPIFCCGEKLDSREAGKEKEVVGEQVKNALFELKDVELAKVVIAYEPVWAIGTGKTATSLQAQEMHAFIRSLIAENYSADIAAKIPVLYGGSVKPGNAKEIFSQQDVDGGLIGGASLKSRDFTDIVKAF